MFSTIVATARTLRPTSETYRIYRSIRDPHELGKQVRDGHVT